MVCRLGRSPSVTIASRIGDNMCVASEGVLDEVYVLGPVGVDRCGGVPGLLYDADMRHSIPAVSTRIQTAAMTPFRVRMTRGSSTGFAPRASRLILQSISDSQWFLSSRSGQNVYRAQGR